MRTLGVQRNNSVSLLFDDHASCHNRRPAFNSDERTICLDIFPHTSCPRVAALRATASAISFPHTLECAGTWYKAKETELESKRMSCFNWWIVEDLLKGLLSARSTERLSEYILTGEEGLLSRRNSMSFCRAITSASKDVVGETKRNLLTACTRSGPFRMTKAAPAAVGVWEPSVKAWRAER